MKSIEKKRKFILSGCNYTGNNKWSNSVNEEEFVHVEGHFIFNKNDNSFKLNNNTCFIIPFDICPRKIGSISIEFWILTKKSTDYGANIINLFSLIPDYKQNRDITINKNKILVETGMKNKYSNNEFEYNKWIHLVISWNQGKESALYINGVKNLLCLKTLNTVKSEGKINYIMINGKGEKLFTSGEAYISDIGIYHESLSDSEVKELYSYKRPSLQSNTVFDENTYNKKVKILDFLSHKLRTILIII